MTIAAAFICNNGVVLGADTEVTRSVTSKTYESKILRIHHNVDLYLTYSGNVDFVREMIERVKEKTGLVHNPVDTKPSPDKCFDLIRAEYQAEMERELQKPPDSIFWTELLVAVRRDMYHLHKAEYEYRTTVYHLKGQSVIPVDHYAAIGIGSEMGHAIFGPLYRKFALTLEGAFIMINALRRTKASVPGCGGSSNILMIANSGDWPIEEIPQAEIKQIEADCEFLDQNVGYLYEWFPSSLSKKGFEHNFRVLKNRLLERRSRPGRLKFPLLP
jgi:20S proteasome alpha/beta subunit